MTAEELTKAVDGCFDGVCVHFMCGGSYAEDNYTHSLCHMYVAPLLDHDESEDEHITEDYGLVTCPRCLATIRGSMGPLELVGLKLQEAMLRLIRPWRDEE